MTRAATEHIRIAGAGVACLDYIVVTPGVAWGDTAHISAFHEEGGGLTATALAACARLGAECRMLGFVGADETAGRIVRGLKEAGVGTSGLVHVSGATSPFSFVHVNESSGERTIFHHRLDTVPPYTRESLAAIRECAVLLVDDYFPELTLAAAQTARDTGIPVVADLTPDPKNAALLRFVDICISPRHFARDLGFGDQPEAALEIIHGYGPTTAVITLGADGCIFDQNGGVGREPALAVDVVDTTGAGDVFHGAFAWALAHGAPVNECARIGAATAALKCTRTGGRAGIPDLPALCAFLTARNVLPAFLGPSST